MALEYNIYYMVAETFHDDNVYDLGRDVDSSFIGVVSEKDIKGLWLIIWYHTANVLDNVIYTLDRKQWWST